MSSLATHFPLTHQKVENAAHITALEAGFSVQSYTNHASNLGFLLYGLSQSRRWVYYFNRDFKLSTDNHNILQIKYKSDSPLIHWVDKVIKAKQCAAIVIEKSPAITQSLHQIKSRCEQAGMMLIVIDPRQ